MTRLRTLATLTIVLLLAGCNFPGINPSATTPPPIPEETLPPIRLPSATEGPVLPPPPALPEETILILEPGPGSRLVGSIHIAGMADPTFEQFLGIRILLDDGSVAAQTSTTIQADWGNRGPFAVDVPFTIAGERNAFIHVFIDSPRDGGITHLNSVGVILAESGPVNVAPARPHPEDIVITLPASGATVSGGMAHVEGIGIASFEQTLVISIQNVEERRSPRCRLSWARRTTACPAPSAPTSPIPSRSSSPAGSWSATRAWSLLARATSPASRSTWRRDAAQHRSR